MTDMTDTITNEPELIPSTRLADLIESNSILLFNHFRIGTTYFLSLFMFEKSLKDYKRNMLIYIDDISDLSKMFDEDLENLLLYDTDELEELRGYLLIFASIEKFRLFESIKAASTGRSSLEGFDLRIVILNNVVSQTVDTSIKVLLKLNYSDKFVPITYFEDENKIDKLMQMHNLYFLQDNITIDLDKELVNENPDDIVTDLTEIDELYSDNIHFLKIPSIEVFEAVRTKLMRSYTKLFFYIKYQDNGDMTEDVERYNELVSELNRAPNMTYDITMCYRDNFLVFV